MTQKIRKTLVEPNFMQFIAEVVALAIDGWELDTENPPVFYGVMYEANFLKDEDKVVPDPLTRVEVLTKARAAKKAKSEAPAEGQPQEAPQEPVQEDGALSDEVQAPQEQSKE